MANNKLYTIEEYLDSRKTPNGGYTRETLAELGVTWPPKKGWKRDLIMAYKQSTQKASGPDYNSAEKGLVIQHS